MELVVGGKTGLKPEEKSAIDFAVSRIYTKYFENPVPENMPILQDLYNELLSHKEDLVSQHIAQCMYLYVEGSNNLFNHHTNVDLDNRIICFDIKSLGKTLKKLGMLVVQDAVWNRVTVNREMHKFTRFYIDEFHLLLKDELTAAYSMEIWKRFRKWGGIPTGITQNIGITMVPGWIVLLAFSVGLAGFIILLIVFFKKNPVSLSKSSFKRRQLITREGYITLIICLCVTVMLLMM